MHFQLNVAERYHRVRRRSPRVRASRRSPQRAALRNALTRIEPGGHPGRVRTREAVGRDERQPRPDCAPDGGTAKGCSAQAPEHRGGARPARLGPPNGGEREGIEEKFLEEGDHVALTDRRPEGEISRTLQFFEDTLLSRPPPERPPRPLLVTLRGYRGLFSSGPLVRQAPDHPAHRSGAKPSSSLCTPPRKPRNALFLEGEVGVLTHTHLSADRMPR